MNISIQIEDIKNWLIKAKEEHTTLHGDDPEHDWVTFYAESIHLNLLGHIHGETAKDIGKIIWDSIPAEKQFQSVAAEVDTDKKNVTIHDFSVPVCRVGGSDI